MRGRVHARRTLKGLVADLRLTSSTHHTSRPKQSSHHRPNELKHLRWLHAHCANGIDGTIIDLIKEFDISTAIISSARKSMIVNE